MIYLVLKNFWTEDHIEQRYVREGIYKLLYIITKQLILSYEMASKRTKTKAELISGLFCKS